MLSETCCLRYFAYAISPFISSTDTGNIWVKKPSPHSILDVKIIIVEAWKVSYENLIFHFLSCLSVAFKAIKILLDKLIRDSSRVVRNLSATNPLQAGPVTTYCQPVQKSIKLSC